MRRTGQFRPDAHILTGRSLPLMLFVSANDVVPIFGIHFFELYAESLGGSPRRQSCCNSIQLRGLFKYDLTFRRVLSSHGIFLLPGWGCPIVRDFSPGFYHLALPHAPAPVPSRPHSRNTRPAHAFLALHPALAPARPRESRCSVNSGCSWRRRSRRDLYFFSRAP